MKNNSYSVRIFAVSVIVVSAFSFFGCAETGQTPVTPTTSVNGQSTDNANSTDSTDATGTLTVEPSDDFTMEQGDSQAETGMIKLYFIELGTNDLKAYRIGCGDAVIGVDAKYAPVKDENSAETALKMLFAVKEQTYGEKKLYNSLYQSNLEVESLTVDMNKKATLKLTGTMNLSGVCDTPRFEEQIRQTVLQFKDLYTEVEIFLNDKPLKDLL